MERIHPDPYHGVSRESFRAAVDALAARAADLRDDEFLVGVMRLVAMVSTGDTGERVGRDGHSGAWPWLNEERLHRLPLRLWEFPDGVHVTGAAPAHAGLVGARITAVEGTPIAAVLAAVEPLVPRDNPTTVLAFRPAFLLCAEVLTGLGLAAAADRVTLTVRQPGRGPREVTLSTVDAVGSAALVGGWEWTLPAPHLDEPYRITYLPRHRAVHVQYNQVTVRGAVLPDALRAAMAGRRVDRVVVDIRHNHGGDNTTFGPFVAALGEPAVDRPGRLYVLAGRMTFSAAGNFAAAVDAGTEHARFVGEPTGGAPSQYGDQSVVRLPHSGIAVAVARYWVGGADERPAVLADLPVPYTARDHFAGRDPVLAAALTAR